MAFPLSRPQGIENRPIGKDGNRNATQSPKRQPLGDLGTNTRMAPPTTVGLGKKTTPQSPLKRSSIDILDDGRGFQYLKRRKIIEPRRVGEEQRRAGSTPVEVPSSTHVLSETARFRPVSGQVQTGQASTETLRRQREGTSTEPDSPSEEDSGRESQHSFNSLINYDPSSQQATQGPFATPSASFHANMKAHARRKVKEPSLRASQAEILRLRLRVAMYKVRTNQVYTPFARLRVYGAAKPSSKKAHIEPPTEQERFSSEEPELPELPQESHPRTRHMNTETPRLRAPPLLRPTPHSSRLIFGPPLTSMKPRSTEDVARNFITPHRTYNVMDQGGSTVDTVRTRHSSESESTIVYAEQTPGGDISEMHRNLSATPQGVRS